MSDTPTKTYPPEFLQRLVDDLEAEQAKAAPAPSSDEREFWDQAVIAAADGLASYAPRHVGRIPDLLVNEAVLIADALLQARRERWASDGETARNEASTDWQPIETAPRDGTKVMIWLVRQETIAWAQWEDADECYGIPTNHPRWEWQEGSVVSWVPDHPGAVSHWAPLEPPSPTGGQR